MGRVIGVRVDLDAERFGLSNGQFYAFYRYKNLWWMLDGRKIGFGDLKDDQILAIAENLNPDEVFEGYHESHGTEFQQRKAPMIRITSSDILFAPECTELYGR